MAVAVRSEAQIRPEARLEFAGNGGNRAEAGLGLIRPLGAYLRGGIGVSLDVWNATGAAPQGRVETHVRFLLDPLAANRWGLSLAAGLGYRDKPYMLVAADLEGPRRGKVRPAFQFALGGGMRLAFIVRGARPDRR